MLTYSRVCCAFSSACALLSDLIRGFETTSKEQLIEALKTQVEEEVEQGAHRFIGSILVEMKAMDSKQLGAVFLELGLKGGEGRE